MKFGETLEVWKSLPKQAVEVFIVRTPPNGKDLLVRYERSEVEPNDDQFAPHEPSLTLPYEHAQALLDGLWKEGFRPNDGQGSMAHIEALKEQIDLLERQLMDWRHLAYYHMEVPPPEDVSESK